MVVHVATADDLIAAIAAAHPGDEIVLADGTYALTGADCSAAATSASPIVVRAEHPLAAKIEFDGVEGFRVSGASWHFEGLDVRGTCANDSDCEHAFHVTGAAADFVLRDSRVRDFNAQLKINAAQIGGAYVTPNRGLIERTEFAATHARDTSNPVTPLDIDTGDDWIVRGNFIHDFHKGGGDGVSYGVFLKSGGHRGLVERNLVVCARGDQSGGTRIGLSLGGGGTGAAYCAPAFDPDVPCLVEHDGGTLRNNIIASCSDVGIYLNRARDSHVLYNTLIATSGVDFRFDTTSGEATGNVMAGVTRARDGAQLSVGAAERESVDDAQFAAWYRAPLVGDLAVVGDVSSLIGAGTARDDVPDDFCGRPRPSGAVTLGALEHSLGDCAAAMGGDAPTGPASDTDEPSGGSGGCCDAGGSAPGSMMLALVGVALVRRRARR